MCDRRNASLWGPVTMHQFLSRHRDCVPEWTSLSADDFRWTLDDEMWAYVRQRGQELHERPLAKRRRRLITSADSGMAWAGRCHGDIAASYQSACCKLAGLDSHRMILRAVCL